MAIKMTYQYSTIHIITTAKLIYDLIATDS